MPNLRSRDAYRDAAWDWSCLDGCFSGSIRPTDIDGLVERKGHALFLEAKPPNGYLTVGQELTFKSLSRKPLLCAIVFFGEDGKPPSIERIDLYQNGVCRSLGGASFGLLLEVVSSWYKHADSGVQSEFEWRAHA
jgi:hypothetical protein